MNKQKLTPRNAAAMKLVEETGAKIVREYGLQIAQDYRSGSYQWQIARAYNFVDRYSLPCLRIAEDSVGYALKMLIPKDEMQRLGAEHKLEAQKESGLEAKKRGDGIFAMSKRKHVLTGRKGAEKMMKEGLGIFKPGYERKPGENNIRSHGQIPWTDEQRVYFAELKSQGLAYREIAVKLEERFGVRRKPEYLGPYFYRMIKNRKRA